MSASSSPPSVKQYYYFVVKNEERAKNLVKKKHSKRLTYTQVLDCEDYTGNWKYITAILEKAPLLHTVIVTGASNCTPSALANILGLPRIKIVVKFDVEERDVHYVTSTATEAAVQDKLVTSLDSKGYQAFVDIAAEWAHEMLRIAQYGSGEEDSL